MWKILSLTCVLLYYVSAQTVYDAYFGKPVTDNRRRFLDTITNGTSQCTVTVESCKHYELRRIDGTCVNPKFPSRGARASPFLRMLPPSYGPGSSLRPAQNGSMLPSTRLIRTKILADGFRVDHQLSALIMHVFVFSFVDNVDLLYLLRYVIASDCCIADRVPNREDPRCISISVPDDDPYLGDTLIRCMNLTRVETYQDFGCIPRTLPDERYNRQTPLLDLSVIYGVTVERERQIRSFRGGELIQVPGKDGVERPPPTSPFCFGNKPPTETACYEFGDNIDGNLLMGIYLTALWFFREHNRLARELARLNPCWDDQELFETARQINIAQWQYIYYYELIRELVGEHNALQAGIIHDTHGFVNDFDKNHKPGVYHEYVVGCRWFHNFQDGRTDLYTNKGEYLGSRKIVDDNLRPGILENNNTEADITQGTFRAPAAKLDFIIDPSIAERATPTLRAFDLPAVDIQRGRDQGLAPYNQYRKICGLPYAYVWEDFHDTIDPDTVDQLKRTYEDVDDVDVMAGIYSERLIKGGWVGPTLFCIMRENLVNWRKSDRFFFEHGGMANSLTLPQLNEIRKTSIARILCDDGVRVDGIQPRAFLRDGPGNEIVLCKEIPGIDLSKWFDHEHADEKDCRPNQEEQELGLANATGPIPGLTNAPDLSPGLANAAGPTNPPNMGDLDNLNNNLG